MTRCSEHLTLSLAATCFFYYSSTCYSGVIAFSVITIQVFTLMKLQCFSVFYKSYVDLAFIQIFIKKCFFIQSPYYSLTLHISRVNFLPFYLTQKDKDTKSRLWGWGTIFQDVWQGSEYTSANCFSLHRDVEWRQNSFFFRWHFSPSFSFHSVLLRFSLSISNSRLIYSYCTMWKSAHLMQELIKILKSTRKL